MKYDNICVPLISLPECSPERKKECAGAASESIYRAILEAIPAGDVQSMAGGRPRLRNVVRRARQTTRSEW